LKIIYPTSLAKTIDALNEAFFFGYKLTKTEMVEAAKWIASRHAQPGSYASMFAPGKKDFSQGIVLFTGERVETRAATAHILGEEACRALNILKVPDADVSGALAAATSGIQERIDEHTYETGIYCCGKCSVALWRHLSVGKLRDPERILKAGLDALKCRRQDNGRWRSFPFYYTLLALNEMDMPVAIGEMRHAALSLERLLGRIPKSDKIYQRRRTLAERVLAKC